MHCPGKLFFLFLGLQRSVTWAATFKYRTHLADTGNIQNCLRDK